jgi:UDP-N-acetylmuramyl pentapeptide phosphotransferase/UDP-N-acetylglucosamine-1-phosphate transferase
MTFAAMLSCGWLGRAKQQPMIEQTTGRLWVLGPIPLALFVSWALLLLLRPWLGRYVMVQPSARSSHDQPTPQGGGIAVVVAVLVAVWVPFSPALLQIETSQLLVVTAATTLLALVGAVDDIRSLPAAARLAMQCIAVGSVITALPTDLQILPQVPTFIERAGVFVAGVWFVNLVNFMDGVDWMTVAEVVPVTTAVLAIGLGGAIGVLPAFVAAALLGAMLGFAPFNRPVAKVFLGDVGSLPTGLLLGWILLQLAANGHLAAAIILPLYYLADATITLVRRFARGEPIWQAHRTHFYQRATDRGFAVREVITRVFLLNLTLAALAFITVAAQNVLVSLAMVCAGLGAVGWLLAVFAFGKSRPDRAG